MSRVTEKTQQQIAEQYCTPDQDGQQLPAERDLADQLHVSRTTVRAAITNLEARGLVRRYQGRGTFVTSRATAQKQHPRLAMVWSTLDSEIAAGWAGAAIDRAWHRKVDLISHLTMADPLREYEILQHLVEQEIDGILIEPVNSIQSGDTLKRQIEELGLGERVPLVVLGSGWDLPNAVRVGFNNEEAGYVATKHLIESGHKRIAHISSSHAPHMTERTAGYRRAMAEAGLEVPEDYLLDVSAIPFSPYNTQMGRNALRLLLSLPTPPTAIFAYWAELAEGIMTEAEAQGRSIPDELAVIGVAHIRQEVLQRLPRSVSTIWYDIDAMAAKGVDVLLETVRGRDIPPVIEIDFELRPGASTIGDKADQDNAADNENRRQNQSGGVTLRM